MNTKYGDIKNRTTWFYIDNLTGFTYKILPIFEEKNFEQYSSYINDLINELFSYDNIMESNYFLKLILNLEALKTPNPDKNESEHQYVRRKVFECRNLAQKIATEIKSKEMAGADNE